MATGPTAAETPPPAPPAEALPDRERRNPIVRWMVHLGLPITVSLGVHLLLIAALALSALTGFVREEAPSEYAVAITTTPEDPLASMLRWPGAEELDIDAPDTTVDPFDFSNLAELENSARDLGGDAMEDSAGGFGLGDSGRSGVLGVGGGAGQGGGEGLDEGFGTGDRMRSAGVWNLKATGHTFAYVVDFSGSIIVAVDDLKRELRRSIGNLGPGQEFNVFVFYSSGDQLRERFVTEAFESGLQKGTPENKRRFFRWIDSKAPMGSTEPLGAMRRALALRPDAVFFFSDGYFDDSVVEEVARANRVAKAQIHCLVFDEVLLQDTSEQPRMTDGARRLMRIAEQSNGRCKVVTGADVGR